MLSYLFRDQMLNQNFCRIKRRYQWKTEEKVRPLFIYYFCAPFFLIDRPLLFRIHRRRKKSKFTYLTPVLPSNFWICSKIEADIK